MANTLKHVGRNPEGKPELDRLNPGYYKAQKQIDRETVEAELYGVMNAASARLNALSGGGPMGLTPDAVKATPEYRKAKMEYQTAFANVRAFNSQK